MGEYASIEHVIELAERRWPGLEFRRKDRHEASAPCPFCHDGIDRFLCFDDGGFWCRQCGATGWIDDDAPRRLTPQELNEIRLRRLERKQEEHDRRLTALEQMARCRDHLTYHAQLDADDRAYWESQGIWSKTIDRYLLGICYQCPTDKERRPSYTIPVINRGKLVNIRHRIIGAEGGDKYRPHMAGLGNTLFNADHLYAGHESIIIVEGEKKSIVLDQWHFPNVGIMGKSGFPSHWARRFVDFRQIYVALDPDATDQAFELARLFGDRGRVVILPVKADDFFVLGGTDRQFRSFLRLAKKGRAS